MATMNNLRQATQQPAKQGILQILKTPAFQEQLKNALPKSLTAERMTRIVMTEFRKNPVLLQCSRESVLGAIMQSAQLGLEPGSALGHCYIIPFMSGKTYQANLIIGYRGMLDLARRSGQILSFHAFVVRDGDDFSFQLGLHPDIHHVPSDDADRDIRPVTHVYAVANLKDGGVQFEVMSRAAIEAVRNQSKAKNSGPWITHWDEMAKKTVLRRLFKYLPISIETAQAIETDEETDRGVASEFIDGNIVEVKEEPEQDIPDNVDPETGEVILTFAQVADAITKAESFEQLDAAEERIVHIKDKQQHKELGELVKKQEEKIRADR